MCRLVIGPPLVYKTLVCPDNEIIVKAGGFGILAVSVMWGWKIIMMMVKELKKLLGAGAPRRRRIDAEGVRDARRDFAADSRRDATGIEYYHHNTRA